jgi:hypothetical protein
MEEGGTAAARQDGDGRGRARWRGDRGGSLRGDVAFGRNKEVRIVRMTNKEKMK